MNDLPPGTKRRGNTAIRYHLLLSLSWTLLLALLFAMESAREDRRVKEIALSQARAFFQQLVDVRAWNAVQGGVYVRISDLTPPNPDLDSPDRDLVTTNGIRLTLVNPAYMTRQVEEIARREGHPVLRISSLNPIRQENYPSPWEKEALLSFGQGRTEWFGFVTLQPGRESFRYMAPLRTEESCLACHRKQGYRTGDIRGGISMEFPVDTLRAASSSVRRRAASGLGAIWLLGLFLGFIVMRFFRRSREMLEREKELSLTDELTHLHNRRGFMTLARQQIKIAQRFSHRMLLLYLDVDGMKEVNDTYGHKEGDRLLRRFSDVAANVFRGSDITGRIGGDEFAVLYFDTYQGSSEGILQRFYQAVEEDNAAGHWPYPLSVSVGVAEFNPANPATLEELMDLADRAMYRDKTARKKARA